MNPRVHKLLAWMLLLMATAGGRVCGQGLINGDTAFFCITQKSGTKDISYNYRYDAFDGWVVFLSDYDTTVVTLRLNCQREGAIAPMNGILDVWDGDAITGQHVVNGNTDGQFFTTIRITRGKLTMHLRYNSYSAVSSRMCRNLNVSWEARGNTTNVGCSEYNPQIDSITSTSAVLRFRSSDTMWVRFAGRDTIVCSRMVLTGLSPNTEYAVLVSPTASQSPCCRVLRKFYTAPVPHTGCPDVLDLQSDYVRGFYGQITTSGSTTKPSCPNVGIINDGAGQLTSRHTVHRNGDETDILTGGQLHTVGPGLPGSVRLGNPYTGAEAESIEYYLHVDTSLYSLLLLHYAAVLQNPNHGERCQPRFIMEIRDANDSVIDPQCGAADFRASESLGWNTAPNDILWKDWTTVGINLAPYQGQDVKLCFTTNDCCQGGHCGYAYFYVDCHQPFASAELCGTVDTNTFVAPDGFNYNWYFDNPSNPISTQQSVTYPTSEGVIHCRLSFIENPNCYITMNTYISNFWPAASADTFCTVNHGCDGFEVQFVNNSTILGDNHQPLPNHPPCEGAIWRFGDGYSSTSYAPSHTYRHAGTYTVILVSTLSDGTCTDTMQFDVTVPETWVTEELYVTACDSMLWEDGQWYYSDTVGPIAWHTADVCDTLITLHLDIAHPVESLLPTDTFCYSTPYQWRGQTAGDPTSRENLLFRLRAYAGVAQNSCDSFCVQTVLQIAPDTLQCRWQADCHGKKYQLTALTESPRIEWSSSPHDTNLDGHEHDRIVWVMPEDSTTVYSLTSFRTFRSDTLFCPTTKNVALRPVSFPRAALSVVPTRLTFSNTTLTAYDLNNIYPHRQWAMVTYPSSDTLHLVDTSSAVTYPVSVLDDSILVILTVSNGVCFDTAQATVPVVRAALWIPNVFTPNQDINNRFMICGPGLLDIELTIYNRLGLVVFSTDDLNSGWDGTHKGTPCPQGAYPWHLRYRTDEIPNEWQVAYGTVTLLR